MNQRLLCRDSAQLVMPRTHNSRCPIHIHSMWPCSLASSYPTNHLYRRHVPHWVSWGWSPPSIKQNNVHLGTFKPGLWLPHCNSHLLGTLVFRQPIYSINRQLRPTGRSRFSACYFFLRRVNPKHLTQSWYRPKPKGGTTARQPNLTISLTYFQASYLSLCHSNKRSANRRTLYVTIKLCRVVITLAIALSILLNRSNLQSFRRLPFPLSSSSHNFQGSSFLARSLVVRRHNRIHRSLQFLHTIFQS